MEKAVLAVDSGRAPKYITVYDAIRKDITLKKYPEGGYLPPESQLAQIFGVGRNTVRHAIQMLTDDGLVKAIQGGGIKVLGARDRQARNSWTSTVVTPEFLQPGENTVSPPAVEKVAATAELAEIFGIPVGSVIYKLQYIWKLDGVPYNYQVQYLNRGLMPGVHRYIYDGPNIADLAKQRWDLVCDCVEERISCKNAGFIEANLLGVELGDALLYTTRVSSCKEGVLEYSEHFGNPQYRRYLVKIL